MTTGAPSCLLADDHPALLAAVSGILEERGLVVVGCVGDGELACVLAEETRPDLAVVDYRMPLLAGSSLVRRLREVSPETRVVVYTAEADEALVREVIEAGAAGVVLKEAPLEDLVRALEAVRAGRSYLDPVLARAAIVGQAAGPSALTARELEVIRLLAEGLSHEEIGLALSISAETVRTHVRKAIRRLGAQTRTHAVATALRLGLIT